MSYIVLARKFRPRNFDEVIGQEHITSTLKNAIKQGKVAHAYIFSGPRGIGKTSCARILAKSLNCKTGPTISPCEKCDSCKEINESRSFDVIEIDGASNRGIDEIRALRENVKFSPTSGKFKIYIIDEVHMLTTEAFNALLKTLEEPPSHVKFIFATTQVNKVPPTILSRCQKFEFRKISIVKIIEKLEKIAQEEKLNVDKDAFFAIAKAASGSMRDAESILDQISAFSNKKIKFSDVSDVLGIVEEDYLFEITDLISQKDAVSAIKLIDRLINEGKNTGTFISSLIEHFRNLLIARVGGKSLESLLDLPPELKDKVLKQSQQFSVAQIINIIETFVTTQEIARKIDSLHIPLEMAIAKLATRESAVEYSEKRVEVKKPIDKNPKINNPKDSSSAIKPEAPEKKENPAQERTVLNITLEEVKSIWANLIENIGKIKMSVATFLQEGSLLRIDSDTLIVGLLKEANLHKELLEQDNNKKLIESHLKQLTDKDIKVKFETVQDSPDRDSSEHGPLIKSAMDTFKGRVINRWHHKEEQE
ncbi:MAG: DNA polymerase III subunit gamma/tau [Candidatus Omnitrophica bacterium]|nr:DNA polymerase III subunit gamma/tau [Candidatus Omnitrophota bacterium]HOX53979.1 DNA polymerase III subunit gamma/tau [Candidatus Omnitrophota bacterium]